MNAKLLSSLASEIACLKIKINANRLYESRLFQTANMVFKVLNLAFELVRNVSDQD